MISYDASLRCGPPRPWPPVSSCCQCDQCDECGARRTARAHSTIRMLLSQQAKVLCVEDSPDVYEAAFLRDWPGLRVVRAGGRKNAKILARGLPRERGVRVLFVVDKDYYGVVGRRAPRWERWTDQNDMEGTIAACRSGGTAAGAASILDRVVDATVGPEARARLCTASRAGSVGELLIAAAAVIGQYRFHNFRRRLGVRFRDRPAPGRRGISAVDGPALFRGEGASRRLEAFSVDTRLLVEWLEQVNGRSRRHAVVQLERWVRASAPLKGMAAVQGHDLVEMLRVLVLWHGEGDIADRVRSQAKEDAHAMLGDQLKRLLMPSAFKETCVGKAVCDWLGRPATGLRARP